MKRPVVKRPVAKKPAVDDVVDTPAELVDELRDQREERDERMATNLGRKAELVKLAKDEGKWGAYRVFCQFRLGYFAFLVLMVILMFSFTFLMEIFFTIFLPSARSAEHYTTRAIILLAVLPFALILLSYTFEEASRLFMDAIDKSEGSLSKFRLALTVVVHFLRHRKEMPDDRLHKKLTKAYGGLNEDAAAWQHVVDGCKSLPRLFMGLFTDDPFDDKDKETEDAVRDELEQEFQEGQEKGMTLWQRPSEGTARSRWKKAIGAAKTSVIFGRTRFDGPPLDFSTLVIVDIFCPFLFEVVTIWTFIISLLSTLSPMEAFLDYIQTGFYALAFYLVVWMVCHFWSSRNRKMREFVSNYRRRRRELKRALQDIENERKSEQLWLVDIGFRAYEYFTSLFFTLVRLVGGVCCKKTIQKEVAKEEMQPLTANPSVSYSTAGGKPKPEDANETEEAVEGRNAIKDIKDRVLSWNPWTKFSYSRRLWILIPIVLVSAMISFSAFYIGWAIMGLCLILMAYTIQGRFPQIFGTAFRAFITSFVILSYIFFSSTWAVGTFVHGGDFLVYPPANSEWNPKMQTVSLDTVSTTFNTSQVNVSSANTWGAFAQYPVCTLELGTLDIVDFALIADAIYGYNTSVQLEAFAQRFNGTELGDWEYVTRNNETTSHQVWAELYFPSINMTVVAVRGTASATDALEDLHFWFGVSIMQAVNVFVPFLKQLPTTFVVQMLSMNLLNRIMPPPVYTELVDHVVELKKRVGNNLVITGHSLGGAMAAMVGAKTKTPAVSFSGPGLTYTRGRFDISPEDIRDYVLTIKPRRDLVPQVDELAGMVQEIECRRTNPLACHSTVTHMCELYASCGDKRNRDWSYATECETYVQGTPIQ